MITVRIMQWTTLDILYTRASVSLGYVLQHEITGPEHFSFIKMLSNCSLNHFTHILAVSLQLYQHFFIFWYYG